jgi:hypothetical protein
VNAANHPGQLALRRRRAGELASAAALAIDDHVALCPECRARLRALDDEQRRFESNVSFDRFAAGVERASRAPARARRPATRAWVYSAVAMAAGVAIVMTVRSPSDSRVPIGVTSIDRGDRGGRIKGGAGMTVRVAGPAGQRTAAVEATEPLATGERLRVGYQSGGHRYLLSLSIDEHGEVTPLYPEQGASLPVPEGTPSATRYLPDSLELTGTGLERIFVVLSDAPIDLDLARRAARAAYDRAGGDLNRIGKLGLSGEEFTRSFAKP